jgi:hypothetical protein
MAEQRLPVQGLPEMTARNGESPAKVGRFAAPYLYQKQVDSK